MLGMSASGHHRAASQHRDRDRPAHRAVRQGYMAVPTGARLSRRGDHQAAGAAVWMRARHTLVAQPGTRASIRRGVVTVVLVAAVRVRRADHCRAKIEHRAAGVMTLDTGPAYAVDDLGGVAVVAFHLERHRLSPSLPG